MKIPHDYSEAVVDLKLLAAQLNDEFLYSKGSPAVTIDAMILTLVGLRAWMAIDAAQKRSVT